MLQLCVRQLPWTDAMPPSLPLITCAVTLQRPTSKGCLDSGSQVSITPHAEHVMEYEHGEVNVSGIHGPAERTQRIKMGVQTVTTDGMPLLLEVPGPSILCSRHPPTRPNPRCAQCVRPLAQTIPSTCSRTLLLNLPATPSPRTRHAGHRQTSPRHMRAGATRGTLCLMLSHKSTQICFTAAVGVDHTCISSCVARRVDTLRAPSASPPCAFRPRHKRCHPSARRRFPAR
mmetsp:Transcript_61450/g.126913  ORF Transcript_61450/g.126913 Transcript_61450/m.126913 type:complete len:230 (-) Transcript_61450:413-1102(-)